MNIITFQSIIILLLFTGAAAISDEMRHIRVILNSFFQLHVTSLIS